MSVAKRDLEDNRKVTTHRLIEMKQRGEKISMLTAYDYSMAQLIDQAGMDVILVGDSASNVMAGNVTTLPITLDQMIYHGKSVMKAVKRALVVVDLPFGTYQGNSKEALASAIRVMKEQPEKTSNIWHLVCLRPWNEVLKADDNQISEDYSMLERRMEHFLGLHYTENTIENGMKRLSVIKTPFNKTNIDRINRQMLKMSGQRDTLKERWNSALAVYDKMDIVDETEVKDKFVTSVVFWDAILTMILSGILCLIGAIGAGIVAAASQNGILAGTCYFFIAAGLAGIMIRFPKIFMLGSPLKRLKAFGNGIRKALEEQQLLEETHCKVETESNGPDNHIIYLSGGSGRDKALFAQCVNEFFDVIDNQRYILVKKKGHKGLNGFYAIPNCFSKKKEDAERFAKCMHPYIGNYDCVYTRNEKGRELLLEGRVKALANREERCISHKKVKGALE